MQSLIPIQTVHEACRRAVEDCRSQAANEQPAGFARRAMGAWHCIHDLDGMKSVGDAYFAGRIVFVFNYFRERKMHAEMSGCRMLLEAMATTPGINTTYFRAHRDGIRRAMGV